MSESAPLATPSSAPLPSQASSLTPIATQDNSVVVALRAAGVSDAVALQSLCSSARSLVARATACPDLPLDLEASRNPIDVATYLLVVVGLLQVLLSHHDQGHPTPPPQPPSQVVVVQLPPEVTPRGPATQDEGGQSHPPRAHKHP